MLRVLQNKARYASYCSRVERGKVVVLVVFLARACRAHVQIHYDTVTIATNIHEVTFSS